MAFSTGKSAFGFSAAGSSSNSLPFSFSNPSAPKNPTPLAHSISAGAFGSTPVVDANGDGDDDADADVDEVYLEPYAFTRKDKAKWKASGRTLLAAVSPVNGEIAAWVAKRVSRESDKPAALTDPKLSTSDRTMYIASLNKFPGAVYNLYSETHTLFMSLQHIVASSIRLPRPGDGLAQAWDSKGNLVALDGLLGPPAAETVIHMRRLVDMYLEELSKVPRTEDLDEEDKIKYSHVYNIFNLAEVLYLPQDGRGEGLVGEELLDWVNAADPVNINDEGNEIIQSAEPWDQPLFWPFVIRCLLRGLFEPAATFLRTLSSHPHPPIAKLGTLLANNVKSLPRSTNTAAYPLDNQFTTAHKAWLARFRAEFASFLGGRGRGHWLDGAGGPSSEWAGWEDDFRSVLELLEGKPERIFEESSDWREALGAWGVLVDVSLRRDDLPALVKRILKELPVDSTLLEDSIQSALTQGDIVKALMGCHQLDIWLAAHLGDVFDKLGLVPDDEERFDTSLRDYFLLEYSDMMMESPSQSGLWRGIADYLSAAGEQGRNRLKEYIVHVSIRLDNDAALQANGNGMDLEDEDAGPFEHFTELRDTCQNLKLDEEWRTISAIMADRLIRRGEYGLAASMSLSAEDGYTLSRIAEAILDAYVEHGSAEFLRLVDSLPPTMLHDAPLTLNELQHGDLTDYDGLQSKTTMVMFASRLTFLSEFRDYLLYLGQGAKDKAAAKLVNLLTSSIAPVEFWSVLLAESVDLLEDAAILFSSNDTFELMRVLDDVVSNSRSAPVEYLRQLWRHLERQPAEGGSANGTKAANGVGAKAGDEVSAGTKIARRKLDEVRLALARNLARALVDGFDNPF
ncbi:hypothetical protein VHUM_01029 [Vanrija humicola]|uniref:Nuclear pore complex protein Nup85 n=1 Tax=Vanrija humicola TaxID=5417 RepID=A0A7D8V3F3_VANHU|nr:hypothetical protein VHUM_01029 [Vanrija humicola]